MLTPSLRFYFFELQHSVCLSLSQALLKHKAIRGAKRTAVLTQLVARYHKYAEVVPESDSDGEKAAQDGEARRSSRCALFFRSVCVSDGRRRQCGGRERGGQAGTAQRRGARRVGRGSMGLLHHEALGPRRGPAPSSQGDFSFLFFPFSSYCLLRW
jgi:hypothetical protein